MSTQKPHLRVAVHIVHIRDAQVRSAGYLALAHAPACGCGVGPYSRLLLYRGGTDTAEKKKTHPSLSLTDVCGHDLSHSAPHSTLIALLRFMLI